MMRKRMAWFLAAALIVSALGAWWSCQSSGGGGDGGGDACVAETIGGTYLVKITVDQDDCTPANVGTEYTGAMRIDQRVSHSHPSTTAKVYFTQSGTSEEQSLFTGNVCGLQVIGSSSETLDITGWACQGQLASEYSLAIEDAAAGTLSGPFTRSATWTGDDCTSVGIRTGQTCATSETIAVLQ